MGTTRRSCVCAALLVAGCGRTVGAGTPVDAGMHAPMADSDAGPVDDPPPSELDASPYAPRDAGVIPVEPCRGLTRRVRFDSTALGNVRALAGAGDRLAVLEYEGRHVRARVFDIDDERELATSAPYRDTSNIIAHADGFDLVAWDEDAVRVGHVDREGFLADVVDEHRRPGGAPLHPLIAGAIARTRRGLVALAASGDGREEGTLVLDVLVPGRDIETIPLPIPVYAADRTNGALATSEDGDSVVGAVIPYFDEGTTELRFDVDLATGVVRVAEVARAIEPVLDRVDRVAVYATDGTAVGAYAEISRDTREGRVALVWWDLGDGGEVARTTLERISLDGVGLLGIAGRPPAQTIALYAGTSSASTALLAGRIRAPGVLDGAASPLAIGLGLQRGAIWEWRERGIAIAYSGNRHVEVVLACEGAP